MKLKFIMVFFILLSLTSFYKAQKNLRIVKSNVAKISIRDNGVLKKYSWNLSPELKPDPYTTSNLGKKVTFITDVDSITVTVRKDKPQDFVIVKGKDSAWTRVEYQPSYLDILKGAEKFDNKDDRSFPKFVYQSQDNANLQKIRKDLKLDSIAGEGNEISRMINLMRFVHNIVRHDGSSDNPTLKNAIDLINICKKENRGVNCRMMATILNECYLSMGYKSRLVTCLPKNLQDNDCHVINMVYSQNEKKWIWMDPTFEAFVMDEKGNLLGIQEVRERLINNQPLILNPDANWNHKESQTKEGYLEKYMAKNLYRLQTPIESVYDRETKSAGKTVDYIQLIPMDMPNQEKQKGNFEDKSIGYKVNYFITNNIDKFFEN